MTEPARLLVVCTANVCRSPLAQRVLQDRLPEPVAALVESAGTRTEEGWAMCPVSASVLPDPSGDAAYAEAHRSRPVTRRLVEDAGLVLTMEREQRSAIARLAPGSQAKVFTLREAAALAAVLQERGTKPVADLEALAQALHSVRGFAPMPPQEPVKRRWFQKPLPPEDPLTIVDGHGLPEPEHLAAVETVRSTTEQVAAAFTALLRA
jgi:protein-tyrosine phosphatase